MLCIHDIIWCEQAWTWGGGGGSSLKPAPYLVFYLCEKNDQMNGIHLKLTFCLVFFSLASLALNHDWKLNDLLRKLVRECSLNH